MSKVKGLIREIIVNKTIIEISRVVVEKTWYGAEIK